MTRGAAIVAHLRGSRSKYGAVRVGVDNYLFDSKKEALRYGELRLMKHAGMIQDLQVHPSYELHCAGVKVATYIADFSFVDCENGEVVIEDCKNPATAKLAVYRLKKRMVAAEYGVVIREL